jgi:hypothetical protein
MSAGRHPRIGVPWSASTGLPAPTLWLPLRSDLLDDSANAFSNTSSSVPTIDAVEASPIGAGCADFVASSNQFLEFADNTLLDPGTDNFFITYWAYLRSIGNTTDYPATVAKGSFQSSTGAWSMYRDLATDTGLNFAYGNPWVEGTLITGGSNFPGNTWVHIYIQRSGNTMTLRSGGVSRATLDVTGVNFDSSHVFRVGNDLSGGNPWNGFIQDFVYCKGSTLTTDQIDELQTTPYTP